MLLQDLMKVKLLRKYVSQFLPYIIYLELDINKMFKDCEIQILEEMKNQYLIEYRMQLSKTV